MRFLLLQYQGCEKQKTEYGGIAQLGVPVSTLAPLKNFRGLHRTKCDVGLN